MCDSWRTPPGPEMEVSEVEAVFGKLGTLDVVRLTGGEPFLRADLLELAEAVRRASRPARIHITTNGSMPERVVALAQGFSEPARLWFLVSLDGLADSHNANRGPAATFDRAVATIRCLAGLQAQLGLRVDVNHTIVLAQSMAEAVELRAMFAPLGVTVHSVLAYEESAMYSAGRLGASAGDLTGRTGYPLYHELPEAESRDFVRRELARCARQQDRLTRLGKSYYLRGLHERLSGRRHPSPQPRCVALRSHVRLLPDGQVPVCQFNTKTVGNLLDQGFEELWHGSRARAMRQWVDACPGCWAECEVLPNAVYSGDLLGFARAVHGPVEPPVGGWSS
jgi:MoaA/NifB/PqqE/SkfB family radical SAM enzyme